MRKKTGFILFLFGTIMCSMLIAEPIQESPEFENNTFNYDLDRVGGEFQLGPNLVFEGNCTTRFVTNNQIRILPSTRISNTKFVATSHYMHMTSPAFGSQWIDNVEFRWADWDRNSWVWGATGSIFIHNNALYTEPIQIAHSVPLGAGSYTWHVADGGYPNLPIQTGDNYYAEIRTSTGGSIYTYNFSIFVVPSGSGGSGIVGFGDTPLGETPDGTYGDEAYATILYGYDGFSNQQPSDIKNARWIPNRNQRLAPFRVQINHTNPRLPIRNRSVRLYQPFDLYYSKDSTVNSYGYEDNTRTNKGSALVLYAVSGYSSYQLARFRNEYYGNTAYHYTVEYNPTFFNTADGSCRPGYTLSTDSEGYLRFSGGGVSCTQFSVLAEDPRPGDDFLLQWRVATAENPAIFTVVSTPPADYMAVYDLKLLERARKFISYDFGESATNADPLLESKYQNSYLSVPKTLIGSIREWTCRYPQSLFYLDGYSGNGRTLTDRVAYVHGGKDTIERFNVELDEQPIKAPTNWSGYISQESLLNYGQKTKINQFLIYDMYSGTFTYPYRPQLAKWSLTELADYTEGNASRFSGIDCTAFVEVAAQDHTAFRNLFPIKSGAEYNDDESWACMNPFFQAWELGTNTYTWAVVNLNSIVPGDIIVNGDHVAIVDRLKINDNGTRSTADFFLIEAAQGKDSQQLVVMNHRAWNVLGDSGSYSSRRIKK